MLIKSYYDEEFDNNIINEFIKFIWDYYNDILKERQILINQNNKCVKYDEESFADEKRFQKI